MLSRDDIERLGLAIDHPVTMRSEAGSLSGVLVRSIDIRPGNAVMYFPEANALVPGKADRRSRTPGFKNVTIRIDRSPSAP